MSLEITSADGVVTVRYAEADGETMADALSQLGEGFVRAQLDAVGAQCRALLESTAKEAHWAKLQALDAKDREQLTATVEQKHAAKVKPQGPPEDRGRPA